MKNRVNWVAVGKRGNAGDALLYEVTKSLFEKHFEINFISAQKPSISRIVNYSDKIIIGPGAILSGTFTSKIFLKFLSKNEDILDSFKFYLFSLGVTTPITKEEKLILNHVFEQTKVHLVRGRNEIKLFKEAGEDDSLFCPCPSLFASDIFEVSSCKKDVIILNLDSFLFNPKNYKNHPLLNFKKYANSLGLEVKLLINGRPDVNEYMLEIFEPISYDQLFIDKLLKLTDNPKEFANQYNEVLQRQTGFINRYNFARFAFGKRLHGWLPFFSLDIPAAFIGHPNRRKFPADYFSEDFLCDVPRNKEMSQKDLEVMSEMMISKLNFFIKNENNLCSFIKERKEQLNIMFKARFENFLNILIK